METWSRPLGFPPGEVGTWALEEGGTGPDHRAACAWQCTQARALLVSRPTRTPGRQLAPRLPRTQQPRPHSPLGSGGPPSKMSWLQGPQTGSGSSPEPTLPPSPSQTHSPPGTPSPGSGRVFSPSSSGRSLRGPTRRTSHDAGVSLPGGGGWGWPGDGGAAMVNHVVLLAPPPMSQRQDSHRAR